MKQGATNFAYLMNLMGIKTAELCEAIGADKTLVSRWRSGARKLMPGHHWAADIAEYFIKVDGKRKNPVLRDVLSAYYPGEKTDTAAAREPLLIHWLTNAGQLEAEYRRQREGVFAALMDRVERLSVPKPKPEPETPALPIPKLENTVVYGVPGVQGSALQFIDLIMQQPQPQDVWYVCPEGLEMYTRDEKFAEPFMRRMMEMFEAGHTLNVVLRTDYKMTDVSAFSGPWLVAHLLGYVKSHYFDEFSAMYEDKMLSVVQGKMAMKVTDGEGGVYTSIHFDRATVDSVWREITRYRGRSKQRFHYELFEHPDGFLAGITPLSDRVHYRFSRTPHFVLPDCMNNLREYFGLNDEENAQVMQDFGALMEGPEFFEAPVRHIFCENEIEGALLKDRHIVPELTGMTGRRVLMTTQTFVNQLIHIKKLLQEQKNYEVCFLSVEHFDKIHMQISCWGDRAAIGWVSGGRSTACRDYTNVNALTGFCETVWNRIPGVMKNRRAAVRKLNTWLKMAEKYGYAVN